MDTEGKEGGGEIGRKLDNLQCFDISNLFFFGLMFVLVMKTDVTLCNVCFILVCLIFEFLKVYCICQK